jgi:Uma2 family endonuclease
VKSARRPATYDDLRKVPEHMVAEIIDGELITSPRPAFPHARAASVLGSDLMGGFDGPPGGIDAPGGWWFLDEPELHFGADVVVPDVAGWRRARVPVIPNVVAFEQAPDWVCEVISPSTAQTDRGSKMRIYGREGVSHLWLLDPLARTLEVYRRESERWVVAATYAGDAAVRAEPFEALSLTMRRWWLEAL